MTCFSERGYGAVSVEMIHNTAQVSVGSLYHHFDNKAGVAAAVYAESIRRYHAALLEIVEGDPDAEDGVRSLVEAHHRWVSTHPDWARFMISTGDLAEIKAEAADHAAANERLTAALVGWAQPLMDNEQLVRLDPLTFMSVLFGPSYFHTRASMSQAADPLDPDVAADFAATALRALRGPAMPTTR